LRIHARIGWLFASTIETVGKQALEQSGKYRVNKNDEESFAARRTGDGSS